MFENNLGEIIYDCYCNISKEKNSKIKYFLINVRIFVC